MVTGLLTRNPQLLVGDRLGAVGDGEAFHLRAREPVHLLVEERDQRDVARQELFELTVDGVAVVVQRFWTPPAPTPICFPSMN